MAPSTPDKLTDWVRTVVPVIWATVIAWLVRLGVPESFAETLNEAGGPIVLPAVIAAVYGVLKGLESKMPPWLSKALMGSKHEPEFPTKPEHGKHAAL